MRPSALAAIGVAIIGLAGTTYYYKSQPGTAGNGAALAQVRVVELSTRATEGMSAFNANCSVCHGKNAAGVDGAGPPLVHVIYEPNHHGDASFHLAVKNGVRAHHWSFGNMPAIDGVTDEDIEDIITYIRELQRANGIR